MKLQEQGLYKHKNCLDMHIYILSSRPALDEYTVWLVNDQMDMYWGSPEYIKIKEKDLVNWTRVSR